MNIGIRCSLGIGESRGGRKDNQDNFLAACDGELRLRGEADVTEASFADGHGVLVAVADGMGGHDSGDLASATAVQALARLWQRGRPHDAEVALRDWVPAAHARIRERCGSEGRINMGTTLTALWLLGGRAGWVHVGDSRLYRRRGAQVHLLSRDQTHAEFARRDQRPAGPNAAYPAQSFIYGSRGLGDDAGLRIDPGVDSGTLVLVRGDRFLLCSDGVSAFVPPDILQRILCHAAEAEDAAASLVEAAVQAGSDDNQTALVLDVTEVAATVAPPTWEADDTLVPFD